MSDSAPVAAAEEIARLLAEWARAIETSDVHAITALVAPDAEFWTNGAAPVVGRDGLGHAMATFFQRFRLTQRFDCVELLVREDIAFMRGTERNSVLPLDGGDPIAQEQRAFSVIRRDSDGLWRFWRGMTNVAPKSGS